MPRNIREFLMSAVKLKIRGKSACDNRENGQNAATFE